MTRVVIEQAASQEIADASAAYEATQPGLARVFLAELDRTLTGIASYPFLAARVAPGIRRCMLRRFPFCLIYRLAGDEVQVLAILAKHADARRPALRSRPTRRP